MTFRDVFLEVVRKAGKVEVGEEILETVDQEIPFGAQVSHAVLSHDEAKFVRRHLIRMIQGKPISPEFVVWCKGFDEACGKRN